MKEYTTELIRNIALVSHSGAGKTMFAEASLFFTGATTRLGKIDDGTTVSDFEEEEIRRKISLSTSVIPVEYKDHKINFLDTPGYTDFVGEVISALRVSDGVVVLVDSVAGLEVGTEIAWQHCDLMKLPRFVVINKMERDNANFLKALATIQEFSSIRVIPVQLPWGEKTGFQGVIDLITMKAYKSDGKTIAEVPDELKAEADEARMVLVEAAAEGEDALLEKYLDTGELSIEEVQRGLRSMVGSCGFIPAFCGSLGIGTGVSSILDAIVSYMPSPADIAPVIGKSKDKEEELKASDSGPLAAYIWKTTADPYVGKQTFFRLYSGIISSDSHVWNQNKNIEERFGTVSIARGKETIPAKVFHSGDIGEVPKLSETSTGNTLSDKNHPLTLSLPTYPKALYHVAVVPKTQADSTKISPTLTRLCEEDLTLSWHMDQTTNQTILQGMGDQHIDVAVRRATHKFQVHLQIAEPRVPYKEACNKKAEATYRHKKQTGGSGQFGEVSLRIEPCHDKDFDFTWDVVGGSISQSYSSSIQKGILSIMKEGALAGYPISGVRVSVFDGKEHPVDSKPIAFEIAGREAFRQAFKDANPVLQEPIMNAKITVPEANMGDILGDLNTRRARVQGMETDAGHSTVTAHVPLVEMLRYTTHLRSMTGGRGVFDMDLDHYEVVPAHITAEIVAARQKELAAKKEE